MNAFAKRMCGFAVQEMNLLARAQQFLYQQTADILSATNDQRSAGMPVGRSG
jgi:hypothetical protein